MQLTEHLIAKKENNNKCCFNEASQADFLIVQKLLKPHCTFHIRSQLKLFKLIYQLISKASCFHKNQLGFTSAAAKFWLDSLV